MLKPEDVGLARKLTLRPAWVHENLEFIHELTEHLLKAIGDDEYVPTFVTGFGVPDKVTELNGLSVEDYLVFHNQGVIASKLVEPINKVVLVQTMQADAERERMVEATEGEARGH